MYMYIIVCILEYYIFFLLAEYCKTKFNFYDSDTAFTQCPRRWVRLSCGVSMTRVYTVIPLKEQTPQVGQNEQAQVRNLSCYTWKSSIHWGGGGGGGGGRPSFLFTHTKQAGSNLPIWRSTKGGSEPAIGASDFAFTLRGKRWV